MEDKEKMVAMSFKIPRGLHIELKIEAIRSGKTLSEFIMDMVRKEIGNGHVNSGHSPADEG